MNKAQYNSKVSRRSSIKSIALCSGVLLFQQLPLVEKESTVRFGLIADVHQDIMHDACARMQGFVDAMNEAKPDFICHLGDLCQPRERNKEIIEIWNQFKGPRYHVLGNHDMDGGFTREQTVAFFGMPAKHYSFDRKGAHFIVLDGNEPGGKAEGYKRYVSKEQLEWLRADLAATSLPSIVFVHQPLIHAGGMENCDEIREVLEKAKASNGTNKVIACFCAHFHDDQAKEINGIHYVHINSTSYMWLGKEFKHKIYSKEIHEKYPSIKYTAPYEDPIWAFVEIDMTEGNIVLRGKKSSWVGATPWELGVNEKKMSPEDFRPEISDRVLSF